MIKPSRRDGLWPHRLLLSTSSHIDDKDRCNAFVLVPGCADRDNDTERGNGKNRAGRLATVKTRYAVDQDHIVGSRTSVGRWLLPFLFLLILTGQARANGDWDNCTASDGSQFYFPAITITPGRDAVVGDVVGPWNTLLKSPIITCTRRAGYGGSVVSNGMAVALAAASPSNGNFTYDGQSYLLLGTIALSDTGSVNFIARWRSIVDGQSTNWQPITRINFPVSNVDPYIAVAKAVGETTVIGIEVQVRAVLATVPAVGSLSPGTSLTYIGALRQGYGNTGSIGTTYNFSVQSETFQGGGTCTTPDVNVQLPTASISAFSGAGTTVLPTAFNLSFNNCPAGLAGIKYRFDPTTSVVNPSVGVVASDSTSTATGVAIRILIDPTSSGTYVPVNFASGTYPYSLSNHDLSGSASHTVPMRAAYYQTVNHVTAGTVRSAVTFTINYK